MEKPIVHSGEGKEAQLVCIVHGESQPEVSELLGKYLFEVIKEGLVVGFHAWMRRWKQLLTYSIIIGFAGWWNIYLSAYIIRVYWIFIFD